MLFQILLHQSATYIVYKKKILNHIIFVPNYCWCSWLYPGLKDCVSFRTFVFLAVYALYRELIIVIYRAFTFRFVLSNKNRTSNSLMQLCSFLKRAFILTVLDCCLELGAIPVSCSCERCASRPVSDYIPFYMRVIESAQFSNVFTFHYLGIISM